MSSVPPASNPWRPWLALIRLPAVFTVIAQIAGAYLYVAGASIAWGRLTLVLAGGVALYWAGMILNDLWDRDEDARDRPSRPIPSGQISPRQASVVGWGLLLLGIGLSAVSGFVQHRVADEFVWLPGLIAGLLALSVVLYDGPLKSTWLAPATMGLCRTLCFLLGSSAAIAIAPEQSSAWNDWFPPQVMVVALGMGIYVMGITQISLTETTGGPRSDLVIGVGLMLLGSVCLALPIQFASRDTLWAVDPGQRFPLLIGMIVISVLVRGVRVIGKPEVPAIRQLIRIGLLTLIPFSAAFALIGAGILAGLLVFALVIPSLAMSRRIQVT